MPHRNSPPHGAHQTARARISHFAAYCARRSLRAVSARGCMGSRGLHGRRVHRRALPEPQAGPAPLPACWASTESSSRVGQNGGRGLREPLPGDGGRRESPLLSGLPAGGASTPPSGHRPAAFSARPCLGAPDAARPPVWATAVRGDHSGSGREARRLRLVDLDSLRMLRGNVIWRAGG